MLKSKPFVIFLFLSFFSLIIFLLSNFFANLDYSGEQEIESNLNTDLNCEGENRNNKICSERNEALATLTKFQEINKKLFKFEINNEFLYQLERIKFKGDAFYDKKLFPDARKNYEEALKKAENKLTELTAKVNSLILESEKLYLKEKYSLAEQKIKQALEIEQENKDALVLLNRIKVVDQIKNFIDNSDIQIVKKNFEKAENILNKAMVLDSKYPGLAVKLKDLRRNKKDFEFNQLIKQSFDQLELGKLTNAINFYAEAKKMKPDDKKLINLQNKITKTLKDQNLKTYTAKGKKAFEDEDWEKSVFNFNKALEINPNLEELIKLKILSIKLYELDSSLNFYLANQDRLQSKNIYQNAEKLILSAKKINSPSNKQLSLKVNEFEKVLEKYSKKIKVNLRSNRKTLVEIEYAIKFDPFEKKEFLLRPGGYTLIAKRKGFESIRKTIDISPNQEEVYISAICDNFCSIKWLEND
tara:strand:- start:865 stop:2280 length:1416 start_codon:yes stop_codon:yes gene_type:complete